MTDDPILTTKEMCQLVRIGRTKAWELVKSGDLPCFRISDGITSALRYRKSEVMVWFDGRRFVPKKPRRKK